MESIKKNLRRYDMGKTAEIVLLIVSLFFFADTVAVLFEILYLGTSPAVSALGIVTLSNLLFIEGALIFAIGTFAAVARSMQSTKPLPPSSSAPEANLEPSQRKRMHPSVMMAFIGIILIILSVLVGTLLI
jgi:hypothetical protein